MLQNIYASLYIQSSMLMLGLALIATPGRAGAAGCEGGCAGDFNGDGQVTIDEIITAVNNALNGCPVNAVVLKAPTHDSASVTLAWDPIQQSGFESYRIYRAEGVGGSFQVIAALSDPSASTYRDASVTLGTTYLYYVAVRTTNGAESPSNTVSASAGSYVEVNGQVESMLADPSRPYLYAIDRVNNSLYFVNTTTMQLTKTIFVGSMPTDLDIDQNGNELFVANFGGTEIAVVDLDQQEKSRSLFVDTGGLWEGNPYRLACGPHGQLVFTSLDQWNALTMIDTTSGARLFKGGSIYEPDLIASPDRTRIYVGESGISSGGAMRFDISADGLTQVDEGPEGGYSGRIIVTSGDGKYVFYAGQKVLANNLKSVLGSFPENIYAANADGSVVISDQHIFNGNTFSITRSLPVNTTTMAMAPDDHTLYLYDVGSSRIYFFDLEGP